MVCSGWHQETFCSKSVQKIPEFSLFSILSDWDMYVMGESEWLLWHYVQNGGIPHFVYYFLNL